jgi:hypothetical protein
METTFSVQGQLVTVDVDHQSARHLRLTVRLNQAQVWAFDEPGWRPIGYGVTDDVFFCWSARRVHALSVERAAMTTVASSDEDIVVAFPRTRREWIVVCETSVRRLIEGAEMARYGLSEVAVGARLADDVVQVYGFGRNHWSFDLTDDREPK